MWSSINTVLDWVMNIAYLNILWFVFTLLGLVIFGWMPATVSLYATWRKILRNQDKHVSIFKTFFNEYKRAFFKKNLAGFLLLSGGFLIYFYIQFLQQIEGVVYYVYTVFIYLLGFIYINLLIYLPPVIVHFQLKFLDYFKQAFLISISSLSTTLFFYACIILAVTLFYLEPSLFIVFGFSPLSLVITKGCLFRFEKLGF